MGKKHRRSWQDIWWLGEPENKRSGWERKAWIKVGQSWIVGMVLVLLGVGIRAIRCCGKGKDW